MFLKYLICLFCLGLTACSLLGPVKTDPPKEYLLASLPYPTIKHTSQRRTIQVLLPAAEGVSLSTRMAYSLAPYQIAYFSKNKWAHNPEEMLQPLIIQSLQKTQYFKSVGSGNDIGRYDYVLSTAIMQFHQVFFAESSVFRMKLQAQLINATTRRIIASKEFYAEIPAPFYSPFGGVIAANRATSAILTKLANWCTGAAF